jgi:hypothetical protein
LSAATRADTRRLVVHSDLLESWQDAELKIATRFPTLREIRFEDTELYLWGLNSDDDLYSRCIEHLRTHPWILHEDLNDVGDFCRGVKVTRKVVVQSLGLQRLINTKEVVTFDVDCVAGGILDHSTTLRPSVTVAEYAAQFLRQNR